MARKNRCIAMVRTSSIGRRCNRDALEGEVRCAEHLEMSTREYKHDYLPRYYARAMRPALADALSAMIESTAEHEHLNLHEELMIIRHASSQVVALYGAACAQQAEGELPSEALVSASLQAISILKDVSKFVESAARVDTLRQAVATPLGAAANQFVRMVTRAAFEVFGDDYRVREFEDKIKELLASTSTSPNGTMLTPDQDAMDMDASVPQVLEELEPTHEILEESDDS